MGLLLTIECQDCGRQKDLGAVPIDDGPGRWRRYVCKSCREQGGTGKNFMVRKTERNNENGSFRPDF